MTQRTIGALFIALWLLCGVLLLNGATVRIPPSRPGAIRVQAAGVAESTGTAVGGVPRDVQLLELLGGNYAANPSGVDAVWTDTSGNGYNATQSVHGLKPTASTTAAVVVVNGQDFGTVVSSSGFISAMKALTSYSLVIKQRYAGPATGRAAGHFAFSDTAYTTKVLFYSVTDATMDATLTHKQPSGCDAAASYFYRTAPAVTNILDGTAHVIIYSRDTASSSFSVDGNTWANNSGTMPVFPSNATTFSPGCAAGNGRVNLLNAVTETSGVRVFSRLLTADEVSGSVSWTW